LEERGQGGQRKNAKVSAVFNSRRSSRMLKVEGSCTGGKRRA